MIGPPLSANPVVLFSAFVARSAHPLPLRPFRVQVFCLARAPSPLQGRIGRPPTKEEKYDTQQSGHRRAGAEKTASENGGFLRVSADPFGLPKRHFLLFLEGELPANPLIYQWSGQRVSNPWPAAWEAAALPTELCPRLIKVPRNNPKSADLQPLKKTCCNSEITGRRAFTFQSRCL